MTQGEHGDKGQLKARSQGLRWGGDHDADSGQREERIAVPAPIGHIGDARGDGNGRRPRDRRLRLDDNRVSQGQDGDDSRSTCARREDESERPLRGHREDRQVEARDRDEVRESGPCEVDAKLSSGFRAGAEEHHPQQLPAVVLAL